MRNILIAILPLICISFILPVKNNTMHSDLHRLAAANDGPYIFYRNGKIIVKYIRGENGAPQLHTDSVLVKEKEGIILTVNTDEPGKTFNIKLKRVLKKEKAVYKDVKKMFVVSDIEGEFGAFRKLLMANNIIDKDYNWTFDKGHLVLTGDFVDRGNQVTETLWLIYMLEEKAEAVGGYVHFILGNHEIMNLNGDLRYVHTKYMENAMRMNETYLNLFSGNTELGRWLRTKNSMEKTGNILFLHGGVSSAVNQLEMSVTKINETARSFYADSSNRYPDMKTELLYSDLGPFWYRGYYYGENKADLSQIDQTLLLFNVKHIATGHTIIADTISILHGGKLINTDVPHATGKSEGLLIKNDNYYRADITGKQTLIK